MYQCKYCKEEAEGGVVIETTTGTKLTVQYACQGCRHKTEKEMEGMSYENSQKRLGMVY